MKIVIIDDWELCSVNSPAIKNLKNSHNVVTYHDHPTKDQLIERLQDADVIIPIRERTKFTRVILELMKNVKLIAQTGSGVAHIDMQVAKELGIEVTTTAGGSKSVIELVFGYILNFSRELQKLDCEVKQGIWRNAMGMSLDQKTIGIIGLGTIGSGIAAVAQAFGMNVLAWGPTLTKERVEGQGVTYTSLEHLLQDSDYITVHVRRVPETIHLINSQHFKMMKKEAFFINTSRGDIVDETALIEALAEGKIAGAGLDVFMEEPLQQGHPLTTMNNVILTPHIGWKTDQILENFFTEACENILAYE